MENQGSVYDSLKEIYSNDIETSKIDHIKKLYNLFDSKYGIEIIFINKEEGEVLLYLDLFNIHSFYCEPKELYISFGLNCNINVVSDLSSTLSLFCKENNINLHLLDEFYISNKDQKVSYKEEAYKAFFDDIKNIKIEDGE